MCFALRFKIYIRWKSIWEDLVSTKYISSVNLTLPLWLVSRYTFPLPLTIFSIFGNNILSFSDNFFPFLVSMLYLLLLSFEIWDLVCMSSEHSHLWRHYLLREIQCDIILLYRYFFSFLVFFAFKKNSFSKYNFQPTLSFHWHRYKLIIALLTFIYIK